MQCCFLRASEPGQERLNTYHTALSWGTGQPDIVLGFSLNAEMRSLFFFFSFLQIGGLRARHSKEKHSFFTSQIWLSPVHLYLQLKQFPGRYISMKESLLPEQMPAIFVETYTLGTLSTESCGTIYVCTSLLCLLCRHTQAQLPVSQFNFIG